MDLFQTDVKLILMLALSLLVLTRCLSVYIYSKSPRPTHSHTVIDSLLFVYRLCVNQLPGMPVTFKILLIMADVSIFFLRLNYLNYMTTDLVIDDKPFLIDCIEDYLKPEGERLKPNIREIGMMYSLVSKQPTEISRLLRKRMDKFGLNNCRVVMNGETFISLMDDFQKEKAILIAPEPGLDVLMKLSYTEYAQSRLERPFRLYKSRQQVASSIYYFPINFDSEKVRLWFDAK